ncbi:hypothetical protein TNCV_46671 [Trichonephila clavipes]|nr:hypothetical protein TNCV_46671 [Trichonephila clavipes]
MKPQGSMEHILDTTGIEIREQRHSLHYNGYSKETQQNAGDAAKLASFLVILLATWRLIEPPKTLYAIEPPDGELQQRG